MPVAPAFREPFLVRFGGNRLDGGLVPDFDSERVLDKLRVVHSDRVVIGQQRANFDADVAPDAFLKTILHGLHTAAWDRARSQIFDTLHGAEFGAFATRKAQVDVHESDFAWTLFLAPNVFRGFRDAIFLEAALDDFDGAHGSISHRRSASGQARALCRAIYFNARTFPSEEATYTEPDGPALTW